VAEGHHPGISYGADRDWNIRQALVEEARVKAFTA
jgi:hypothetical protein